MKTMKNRHPATSGSYPFIVLVGMLFFLNCGAQEPMATDYPVVAEDASWCWFSDPRAIYHKGKRESIYFGFVTSKGDVRVRSMDLKTGKTDEFTLHKELEEDDHDVPSFLFLPDGRILAFYCQHNGNIFMRKTKNPEDITAWEAETIILAKQSPNLYCYMNPIMLSDENNRIYLFGRNIVREKGVRYSKTQIYCIYSDDYGKTWSDKVNVLDNSGRDTPQYVKYTSDNKSRIDFLFTNGHPKQAADISVHHMYYTDGAFYQTNGKQIETFKDLPVLIKHVDRVYDADKSGVRGWIWDIALDKKNRPVVTYARYPSELQHQYYYAKWNGREWIHSKIADAGPYITVIKPGAKLLEAHYSGGIVLDHANPDNVYLSRNIGDHFELDHVLVTPNGTKVKPITRNSSFDNLRPYVVYGNKANKPLLMWLTGTYYHYTDYDTQLRLKR